MLLLPQTCIFYCLRQSTFLIDEPKHYFLQVAPLPKLLLTATLQRNLIRFQA